MKAMLPDIEVGLAEARAIKDNGQAVDRLQLGSLEELARPFSDGSEQR